MKFAYRDAFGFIGKLSLAKVINILQIVISYYLSRFLKKPVVWGKPVSLSIEPTTSCNLRCPECPSGLRSFTRPTGMIDFDLYRKIIDEQARHLAYLLLYFQGEPFLHPGFLKLVTYAHQQRIYTATSSNGHYFTDALARATVESGLDRLIISIDGTTQETYAQYRKGGVLDKVIDGTKNIVMWKKQLKSATPHLIFQFLVVKPNEHQVKEVYQLAEALGVNEVKLKTAQLYDSEDGNPLMPENEQYSRYKKDAQGKYRLKAKLYNHCWKMWHSTVVTWDGTVVPCCFDKDAAHPLGNVQKTAMASIWDSKKYHGFRQLILNDRQQIDICKNCTEGSKIWL